MSTTDLDLGPVRIVPKGAYSTTATYELLNMVSYEGSSWLMKASSYVVGTTPEEGDTWTLLAQRGETGAAGTNGQDGANGQDGSDATVPDASTTVAGKVQLATDTEISVGTNLTKAVTPKGLADKVAAALASLVNSAPETLDTLNELAAALGDDPNFATTVATNIGTVSTAASVAQTTANSAVSAASAAQSDADAAQSTADTASTTANAALPKAGGTMTGGLVGTTVVANTSVSCPSLVLNGWTVTVSS